MFLPLPLCPTLLRSGAPDLDRYRNRNRVAIVLGAPSSEPVRRQRRELTGPGLHERDLVVLAGTTTLGRRLGVRGNGFAFVLVGKDGHPALVSRTVVARKRLYALIDAMPMRRDEMRRQRTGRRG